MQRTLLRGLPANLNPTGTRCITLEIPDDDEWERALYAEAYQLGLWYVWQRDTGKHGKDIARRWRQALYTWAHCDGSPIPVPSDYEVDMSTLCEGLRFHNGKLQAFCCGAWQDIDGQDGLTLGGSGQPADGTPQPNPGEIACTHYIMGAGATVLVPVPVSTGDVITVQNGSGAVANSHTTAWNGPDGRQMFAGVYLNNLRYDGANPVPAAPNSSLIIKVGGTWYALGTGSFTVPGGVSGEQAIIQVNDSALSGLGGSFAFDVCVTNNQTRHWSHSLDFTRSDCGFVPINTGSGDRAVYVPGIGWQSVYSVGHAGWNELRIYRSGMPSADYNTTLIQYNAPVDVTEAYVLDGDSSSGTNEISLLPLSHGTGVLASGTAPTWTTTKYRIDLDELASGVSHTHTLVGAVVSGDGLDPFA